MKIDYKNGEQIVTHQSGVISVYDKEFYETLVERYQEDFVRIQSYVNNAMDAIGLIDASKDNSISIT